VPGSTRARVASRASSRKKEPTERARASLELLYSISRELAGQLDQHKLLQRILQLTIENVGATSGSILVLDEDNGVTEGALAFEGEVHDHTAPQLADTFERGLAGWVVEHRQAALVANTQEDARWLRRTKDEEARSAVSVPLVAHDRVVGVLTLGHTQAGRYSEEDLELLTAIADQAGIAVKNAQLFAAEQERRQFASTLQEIARTIGASLDPKQVFPQVLEQLERVIRFDSASIFLLDRDRLRSVAARGFADPEAVLGLSLPLKPSILASRVLTGGKPMVVADVQQDPGWLKTDELPESRAIHGWIAAPLVVRDRAVGVLSVDSHRVGAYGPTDVELVMAFADHAAAAVANSLLFDESQRRLEATVALAESARAVTASLDLDDVLQQILQQTTRSLDVEAASLSLVDESSGEIEFKAAWGKGAGHLVGARIKKGGGLVGWVVEHGEPVVVPDVKKDPRFYSAMDEMTGFATLSLACAPIQVQDRTIGALEALNPRQGEFLPDQVELLNGIARLAGSAIAHAQLFAESQEARARYAGLFEDSIDPILLTDGGGTITDANNRAEVFLGYAHNELLGRSALSLHVPDSPDRLPADLGELAEGVTVSYNARATHQNGQQLPVEMHIKRIDIGQQPFLQWILRDISERLALDELRADLTSMIFHDLRSPLGNIISSLEVLQSSLPKEHEPLRAVLSIAYRSSRRLLRLVESLLDLGQLEAGQAVLHLKENSISALIIEVVEEVHPVAEAKGHQLRFDLAPELPAVMMDVDMIRRVIFNLLENAIKYTRGEGRITVSARPADHHILVGVSDTGPGVPAQDRQRIFERFARVQREGRAKGLGLGLAFCRLAVGAHGGRIWVESEEGKGAVFYFTLPL
jgi:NtrC-family two-component system sensor histidine kinase KinB